MAKVCYRLAKGLLDLYLTERGRVGRPTRILIDVGEIDAATHREQEANADNGFRRQHMFHTLLIFDGDTNQRITAVRRPGAAYDIYGLLGVLRRVITAIRRRWPGIDIDPLADTGLAIPAVSAYCEQHGLTYTIGFGPNSRLEEAAAELLTRTRHQQAETGASKVRLISELNYQAHKWDQPRRVIYQAEALPDRPNTRFVVTNRTVHARRLNDWYVDRGEVKNWIKDFKCGCTAVRLSCHGFWANQF